MLRRVTSRGFLVLRQASTREAAVSAKDTTGSPLAAGGAWRLDPEHSSVEFHVRHFYGLVTVKGHFDRFEGRFNLRAQPAIELTIDAASLETKNARRDKHLRSADFFDAANHPQVRFVSDSAVLNGDTLKVHGTLSAAGKSIPLAFDANLHQDEAELDLSATTLANHRELGMLWSPLGTLRAPSKLVIRGHLLREHT
jgi:polyisoprenoid-binding protein YceI